MNGILCLDKPADMTSFACCAAMRRLIGEKKIGHAGTLDPMATGVLPLLIGKATRALDFLPSQKKEYEAVIRFGVRSDTLDIWGQVTPTGKPIPNKATVLLALSRFRGTIFQKPPMMSALKKDGVRLYELARKGVEVERERRRVTVYALDLLSFRAATGEATLRCVCSKGTYIRTLCDDIGDVLGCGAVMAGLRRTQASGYTIQDCLSLSETKKLAVAGQLESHIQPVERALAVYPMLRVTAAQATRFQNGGALALDRLSQPADGLCRVYHPDGHFLGLGQPQEEELKVIRLF